MTYPSNWLSNPAFEKCMVASISYYDFEEHTVYLSSHKYSGIIDGSKKACIPRISSTPSFQTSVETSDKGYTTNINYGTLTIMNSDGYFDSWMDYGFDGRSIKIYIGPIDGSVDTDFILIFDGIIDRLTIENNSTLALSFRDFSKTLDKPIQTLNYTVGETITYTTDTTKTVTISDTLVDSPKPLVFGQVTNITPILLNASYGLYQISSEAIEDVISVYDRGVRLTVGIGYRLDLDKGILELVNNPVGTITCDVKGIKCESDFSTPGTKVYSDKVSTIVKEICYRAGISNTKLLQSDWVGNFTSGTYIKDRTNCLDVIDELLSSINGFIYFNGIGNLILSSIVVPNNKIGSLVGNTTTGLAYGDIVYDTNLTKYILASDAIPTATISYDLTTLADNFLLMPLSGIYTISPNETVGEITIRATNVPAFRTKVGYNKNYTVQTDLAASTLDADREMMAKEYREIAKEDLSIQNKYKSSIERAVLNTCLINSTDATKLTSGLLAKYGRQIYQAEFTTLLTDIISASLGSIVELSDYRFNLTIPRLGSIYSLQLNYLEGTAQVGIEFYTYPNINQYYQYNLAEIVKDIAGTSSVIDYTVTIPGLGKSIVNASQYSGIRYFEITPNLTNIYDFVAITLCKQNWGSPVIDDDSYPITITLTDIDTITVSIGSTSYDIVGYDSVMPIQVIYDFNSHKAAIKFGTDLYIGDIHTYTGYYVVLLDNTNNTNAISMVNISNYYSPLTTDHTRWIQIAKQEVPSYLILDDLELEDGSYLTVE